MPTNRRISNPYAGAETGPDHEKRFVTEIAVGGKVLGRGEGRSKKQAEQISCGFARREMPLGRLA